MFKKIEIWVLYLTILLALIFLIFFGSVLDHGYRGGQSFKFIGRTFQFISKIPTNFKKIITQEGTKVSNPNSSFIEAVSGFSGRPNSPNDSLYLLLARFDGDIEQSVVELVDLSNFNVIHTYNPDFRIINKNIYEKNKNLFNKIKFSDVEDRRAVRHPFLLNDGSIMFLGREAPLIIISENSSPLKLITNRKYHHTIESFGQDKFFIPAFSPASNSLKKFFPKDTYDSIVLINSYGEILYEKTLVDIFVENNLDYLISSQKPGDHFHLNDIQPVLKNGKYWKYGDIFLSLRSLNMVILYRPSTGKVIWKSEGRLYEQHDVDILNDKQISIFNNNVRYISKKLKNGVYKHNEIIIYDFEKNTYTKYLNKALKKYEVSTGNQGLCQILNNGDLFVEETGGGRLFYFKKNGEKLWEYNNKDDDKNYRFMSWSRLLHNKEDLAKIDFFLK